MPEVKNDWNRWTHPRIIFAERVIPAGQTLDITADQTRTGRDMVVDLMGIGAEDLSTQAAGVGVANSSYLRSLNINYQVTERPWWVNAALIPAPAFHNFCGDHSLEGWFQGAPQANLRWARIQWEHAVPWIFNPADTLTIELTAPQLPDMVVYTGLRVAAVFEGAGGVTGLRRLFRIDGLLNQTPIPPTPVAFRFSDAQDGNNQGNEPFVMRKMGFINTTNPANEFSDADTRLLHVFRAKIMPSIGDSWSERGVPLASYGPHMSPPYRVAWHRPVGGPLYLRAGQAVALRVQNISAVPINTQFTLLGRIAFGIGSVGP